MYSTNHDTIEWCCYKQKFCPNMYLGQCQSSGCPTIQTTEPLVWTQTPSDELPDKLTINGIKYRRIDN